MTALSKDEINAWAREAGLDLLDAEGFPITTEYMRFATLCRANLVEEIRTLKADAENFRPTIGLVDKLQLERDALRAEIERLAVKLSHTQLDCQTEAATVVALRAENERLASLAKEYRDNGDRLLDVIDSLKAELSALRVGSGEAVAWRFKCPDGYNLAHADDNGGGEPLYPHPQPSAVPVVRELVEALEKSWNPQLHSNERETTARSAITTGQQWLKECGE